MAPPPLLIVLEFVRAEQAGDPYVFHLAPQEYLSRDTGGGFESARLEWDAQRLADLQALRQPSPDPVLLQRLGETLRSFAAPLGWAAAEPRILEAVQKERPVLITVRSAAAELYALPWELCTLKRCDAMLSCLGQAGEAGQTRYQRCLAGFRQSANR